MLRKEVRVTAGVVIIAFTLLVASCGSSTPVPEPVASDSTEQPADRSTVQVTDSDPVAPSELREEVQRVEAEIEAEFGVLSPFDLFLGIEMDPSPFEDRLNNALLLRAEYHTQCVRAEGFDFFIEPPEVRSVPTRSVLSGDAALVVAAGYGPVVFLRRTVDIFENGASTNAVYEAQQAATDALSAPEQEVLGQVYQECSTQAYDKFPDPSPFGSTMSEELGLEVSQAIAEIGDNDGFTSIWADWSLCMRDRGWEVENRNQAALVVGERASEIDTQFTDLTVGEPVPLQIIEQIDELAAFEADLIEDDLTCGSEVELEQRRVRLQRQLEQEALDRLGPRWSLMRAEAAASDD